MKKLFLLFFIVFLIKTNAQWVNTNGPGAGNVRAIISNGTNLFAGTEGGGVYLSTDNGTNWNAVNSGLTNLNVTSLAVSGNNIFAGTFGGVFLSTNNGTNWTAVNSGLTNTSVYALAISGNNLFAATNGGGVFLSTNNGTSWTAVNSGLNTFALHSSFAVSGSNVFVGTMGAGIFLTSNQGTNWNAVNDGFITSFNVWSLYASDTYLFAGTGVVFRRPLSELITSIENNFEIPFEFNLSQNYPNPFNPSTKISWQSPVSGHTTLKIYDVLGSEVATLVDEYKEAGNHEITVNSRQLAVGNSIASGVYFYRLQVGEFVQTRKMVLNK